MCLTKQDAKLFRSAKRRRFGWKVLWRTNGHLHGYYVTLTQWKLGEWQSADRMPIQDYDGKLYSSGFHVYLNKPEDALCACDVETFPVVVVEVDSVSLLAAGYERDEPVAVYGRARLVQVLGGKAKK